MNREELRTEILSQLKLMTESVEARNYDAFTHMSNQFSLMPKIFERVCQGCDNIVIDRKIVDDFALCWVCANLRIAEKEAQQTALLQTIEATNEVILQNTVKPVCEICNGTGADPIKAGFTNGDCNACEGTGKKIHKLVEQKKSEPPFKVGDRVRVIRGMKRLPLKKGNEHIVQECHYPPHSVRIELSGDLKWVPAERFELVEQQDDLPEAPKGCEWCKDDRGGGAVLRHQGHNRAHGICLDVPINRNQVEDFWRRWSNLAHDDEEVTPFPGWNDDKEEAPFKVGDRVRAINAPTGTRLKNGQICTVTRSVHGPYGPIVNVEGFSCAFSTERFELVPNVPHINDVDWKSGEYPEVVSVEGKFIDVVVEIALWVSDRKKASPFGVYWEHMRKEGFYEKEYDLNDIVLYRKHHDGTFKLVSAPNRKPEKDPPFKKGDCVRATTHTSRYDIMDKFVVAQMHYDPYSKMLWRIEPEGTTGARFYADNFELVP